MGVSGSGKTTVGKLLAIHLKIPFYDGDDYHPQHNIEKMASGKPLNDKDRKPWLITLNTNCKSWQQQGAVLACSALKESYRVTLAKEVQLIWVYLSGSYQTIVDRMSQRNHFMQPEMLQSQFDALEIPNYGIHVSIENAPAVMVSEIMSKINIRG